jgi:hypothetical protein
MGIGTLCDLGPVFRADIAAKAHVIAHRPIHWNAGLIQFLENLKNGI